MSKRTPPTASKHIRSPKIAAKAQRAAQDIVKNPKDSRLGSAGAGSAESLAERHNDSKQEAPLVETSVTAQQEALLVENPAKALQDDCKKTIADNDSRKAFDFSSFTANVRVYQAKLLEVALANMQFAFEFAQRLATTRSPVDFLSVNAEFTSRRIDMLRKHSKEMVELSTKRSTA